MRILIFATFAMLAIGACTAASAAVAICSAIDCTGYTSDLEDGWEQRCEHVAPAFLEYLATQDPDPRGPHRRPLINVRVVRSMNSDDLYFVAADFDRSSYSGPVMVWATGIVLPGMWPATFSVNWAADSTSWWPYAQRYSNYEVLDDRDGYAEVIACVERARQP